MKVPLSRTGLCAVDCFSLGLGSNELERELVWRPDGEMDEALKELVEDGNEGVV